MWLEGESNHPDGLPAPPPVSAGRRWAARAAVLAAIAGVLIPVIVAGLRSLPLLLLGVIGVAIGVAGVWLGLTHRGVGRLAGIIVAAVAVLGVVVVYALAEFLHIVVLSVALLLIAGVTARAALRGSAPPAPEYEAPAPRRPFLIMNPRSGGGKVARYRLVDRAEALGARVALLEGVEQVDVVAVAREAVAQGADLLGVAGGDGTQALVAGVAADAGIPFLVISAGTRNHFALDLGLDRDDPSRCLDALTDGMELRVDLGSINGRPFVNNASFGAYAELVRRPEYRDDKTNTALQALPDLLVGHSGPWLYARAGEVVIARPQALLISNNPYATDDPAGFGRRARLNRGTLGVIGVRVDNAVQAASLQSGPASESVTVTLAASVTVTADADEIPVGVDGESIVVRTPVGCTIHPAALRVRVPRHRPGRTQSPPLDRDNMRALATIAFRRPAGSRRQIGGPHEDA
jgi:diacylglycerol kinase family enzyme